MAKSKCPFCGKQLDHNGYTQISLFLQLAGVDHWWGYEWTVANFGGGSIDEDTKPIDEAFIEDVYPSSIEFVYRYKNTGNLKAKANKAKAALLDLARETVHEMRFSLEQHCEEFIDNPMLENKDVSKA